MEVKNITPEMILLALGVFLALAAAIVGADKFFDVIKKWRKPREECCYIGFQHLFLYS